MERKERNITARVSTIQLRLMTGRFRYQLSSTSSSWRRDFNRFYLPRHVEFNHIYRNVDQVEQRSWPFTIQRVNMERTRTVWRL